MIQIILLLLCAVITKFSVDVKYSAFSRLPTYKCDDFDGEMQCCGSFKCENGFCGGCMIGPTFQCSHDQPNTPPCCFECLGNYCTQSIPDRHHSNTSLT